MNNKELLEAIVNQNLERSMDETLEKEDRELAFKNAMDAIKQLEKMEVDKDSKKTKKIEFIFEGLKIAVPVLTCVMTFFMNDYFMNKTIGFEENGTITTTFGKKVFNKSANL